MDEDDERTDADFGARDDAPTERVRIIGAQPASAMASGEAPVQPVRGDTASDAPVKLGDYDDEGPETAFGAETSRTATLWADGFDDEEHRDPLDSGRVDAARTGSWLEEPDGQDAETLTALSPQLPHWTDPPTGQVPAILDRSGDDVTDDTRTQSGDTGPSWKEHDHEWEDNTFEPSSLADETAGLGALEDTPLEERRPWEFDSLSSDATTTDAEDTAAATSWWEEDGAEELTVTPVSSASSWAPTSSGALHDDSPKSPVSRDTVTAISSSPLRRSEPLAVGAVGGGPVREFGPRRSARREPADTSGGGRNLRISIITGVVVAGLGLLCLWWGSVTSLVVSTVVVVLAAAEYYAAVRKAGHRPATLLGLVATVGVMVVAYTKGVAGLPLIFVLVVMATLVWYLAGAEHGSVIDGVSVTIFGFAWIGILGSFAALMLSPSQYPHRHGVAFLLGAVVAVAAADIGALAIGGWRGRHHMAPRVSPNKTWEGFIGGGVLAVAASVAITGNVHPFTPGKAAILGLVVAVLAPVGDLCESLIKRELGLKDMGTLLPGHGGVLDRFDAVLFVLPATYYLVRVLHLG